MTYRNSRCIRLGVVLRQAPGATRWAQWVWRAVAVLPGAGEASWKLLRREGDVSEFHAATLDLHLYVSDTEAYVHELGSQVPSVYIVLRAGEGDGPAGLKVAHVTASPYEAQDYADSGEEIIEKVAMPSALRAWVEDFVDAHHEEEVFVKRRRDRARVDRRQDGIGDARISQATDVYRAPTAARHEVTE